MIFPWWNNATRGERLVFFSIIFFAIVVRMFGINTLELWHDETGSMLAANGLSYVGDVPGQGFTKSDLPSWNTLPNVISACLFIDSGNGSLYTVLLHGWSILFGNAPAALRSLSMIASLLTVMVAFLFALRLFQSSTAALATAALIASSQSFIGPSVQIRSYALAVLLSLVATALLFRLLRSARPAPWTIVLYGLTAGAAVLTHYSTCYILLAHPIVLMIMRTPPSNILRIALGGALALALFAIWMQFAGSEGLERMRITNQNYVDQVTTNPGIVSFFYATTFRTVLEGWLVQLLCATGNGLQYLGPPLRVIAPLLVVPVMLIVVAYTRSKEAVERRTLCSLCVLLLSSMVYATVLSMSSGHTVSFQAHYAVFAAPYAALLLGRSVSLLPVPTDRLRPLAIVAVVALAMVVITSLFIGRATGIIAPNRYQLYADRSTVALDRYRNDHVSAIHSSKYAAYLFALYGPPEADHLKHFVDTAYNGISGLIVERGGRSWVVPVRPRSLEFPRSEPKDGELWHLDHGGPRPVIPDSVDTWVPLAIAQGDPSN